MEGKHEAKCESVEGKGDLEGGLNRMCSAYFDLQKVCI
jgi:hypothetical protein